MYGLKRVLVVGLRYSTSNLPSVSRLKLPRWNSDTPCSSIGSGSAPSRQRSSRSMRRQAGGDDDLAVDDDLVARAQLARVRGRQRERHAVGADRHGAHSTISTRPSL